MSNTCLQSISKQRRKKYGANAPQLRHIFFAPAWGAVPDRRAKEKQKKYGANAPQLRHILAAVVV